MKKGDGAVTSPAGGSRRSSFTPIALSLAVAVLVCVAWPPIAGAAAPPRDFMGVSAWESIRDTDYARLGKANVRLYRLDVLWYRVEPKPPAADGSHSYDWSFYDRQFRMAALHGVRILPILIGSPRWVAGRPSYPPRTREGRAAFDAFAAAAARRYGPKGRLWTQRPWSAAAPAPSGVRAYYWQVWNEPNTPNYWRQEPSPGAYATMLKRVSGALRRVSANLRVMAAGVVWPHEGIPPETYLARLLQVPGLRQAVDIFAIHPYGKTPSNVMQLVGRARGTLNANGASTVPMWITEVGWASGRYDGLIVPESTQARYLDDLYRQLLGERRRYGLLGATWFSYRDQRSWPGDDYRRVWGNNTGLLRVDSSPKPAWRVFSTRARQGY